MAIHFLTRAVGGLGVVNSYCSDVAADAVVVVVDVAAAVRLRLGVFGNWIEMMW